MISEGTFASKITCVGSDTSFYEINITNSKDVRNENNMRKSGTNILCKRNHLLEYCPFR